MALHWSAKSPDDVYRYTWVPPLADGDGLASFVLSASGCTIDSDEIVDDAVVAFISGGTAGATAIITATAVSDDGEEYSETIYLPIRASTVRGTTVQDVVAFALRKIVGMGETPDADQASDALVRLQAMLDIWRIEGLDVGIAGALALTDVLTVADEYVPALRFNLRAAIHDHYGHPLSAGDVSMAQDSKRLVQNRLFNLSALNMPGLLANPTGLA